MLFYCMHYNINSNILIYTCICAHIQYVYIRYEIYLENIEATALLIVRIRIDFYIGSTHPINLSTNFFENNTTK